LLLREALEYFRGQAARLRSKHQDVAGVKGSLAIYPRAARFNAEHPRPRQLSQASVETDVYAYLRHHVVVEARAPERFVLELKSQRSHEMQRAARIGAQADHVPRVRRNFRLEEHHIEHFAIMPGMNAVAHPGRDPLRFDFCGLDFGSPVVLVSGCVGFGEEFTRIEGFSNREAGAVVLKGTTGQPRLGNPPHRIFETAAGMLNSIGLQNPGVDHVVRRILPELDFSETRFIANVSGSTIEEYVEVTRRFDQSPVDAIEINISCPNVKEGGVAFGNYPEMSAQVVQACRRATTKPIITKLSPNQTDIRENARRCIEAGSDALAVMNTVMGMAIDVRSRRPVIGNIQGGLSGPAIKPIALLKVHQVYEVARRHHVPVIGQGGITNATDALEFIIAGASAVGIGTALFYDPLVCRKINAGITEYLQTNGLKNVTELVGTLQTG
jgi:dihydroorotate dehydrogenase (NAD+) catalytic subunit